MRKNVDWLSEQVTLTLTLILTRTLTGPNPKPFCNINSANYILQSAIQQITNTSEMGGYKMRKCESAMYKIKAKVTFTVYTSTCVTVAHLRAL